MKKILCVGLVLLLLAISVTATDKKCNRILYKQNAIQQKILDLESNFPLTAKQQKLHDRLMIKANDLYKKYEKCLLN